MRRAGSDPGTISTAGNGPRPDGRSSRPASRTAPSENSAGCATSGIRLPCLPSSRIPPPGSRRTRTRTGESTDAPGPPTYEPGDSSRRERRAPDV